jgi:hypothetical protein
MTPGRTISHLLLGAILVAATAIFSRQAQEVSFPPEKKVVAHTIHEIAQPWPAPGAPCDLSRINEDSFLVLAPGEFVGCDILVSPDFGNLNFIEGIKEGCYSFGASLHLRDFHEYVSWNKPPIPVSAAVKASPIRLCFGPPSRASIALSLKNLESSEAERIATALRYFSLIREPRAGPAIRRAIGPAPTRFTKPRIPGIEGFALEALRRQVDAANIPPLRGSPPWTHGYIRRGSARKTISGSEMSIPRSSHVAAEGQ